MSKQILAALSEGKLFLKEGDGPPCRHESAFAQEILDRHQRLQQKDAWKTGAVNSPSMFSRSALWGRPGGEGNLPIIVSAVASGELAQTVTYVLETEAVGGLLEYESAGAHERRLFHREGFRAGHLDRHPQTRRLLCSIPAASGGSNLAVIDPDGSNVQEATEGDSFDDAPSWIPGDEFAVVFQSAGLARNREGLVSGLGPFAIERLDLRSGTMDTLLESPSHDFLQPHVDTEGNLCYIRRPYQGPRGPRPPWTSTLKDALLFPVRLVRAFVHFFDAFSRVFSQKPLITSGGPPKEGPDANRIWIHGRMLETKPGEGAEAKSLAPDDWVLVRLTPAGEESVLARGVLAYDLAADGTLATTDGRRLFIHRNGKREKAGELRLIETVKWV